MFHSLVRNFKCRKNVHPRYEIINSIHIRFLSLEGAERILFTRDGSLCYDGFETTFFLHWILRISFHLFKYFRIIFGGPEKRQFILRMKKGGVNTLKRALK